MIYCDACPSRKLLRRNQVVSLGPCSSTEFAACPLYREISERLTPPRPAASERRIGDEREVTS